MSPLRRSARMSRACCPGFNFRPVEVTAADVFEFLAHQRGDRTVVRLADRESGLFGADDRPPPLVGVGPVCLPGRAGGSPVQVNPVPRGLLTRRASGSRRSRTAPLVRVPRTLPRILPPREADRLVGALRTHRDRAMVLAMVLAGLRRCAVLGLRLQDVQVADRRLVVVEARAAITGWSRPRTGSSTRSARTCMTNGLAGARRRGRAGTRDLPRAAAHVPDPVAREAGMALKAVQAQAGHASIEPTRVYLANDWLAGEYRRAAELLLCLHMASSAVHCHCPHRRVLVRPLTAGKPISGGRQRSIREPCLVTCPRITFRSDS